MSEIEIRVLIAVVRLELESSISEIENRLDLMDDYIRQNESNIDAVGCSVEELRRDIDNLGDDVRDLE